MAARPASRLDDAGRRKYLGRIGVWPEWLAEKPVVAVTADDLRELIRWMMDPTADRPARKGSTVRNHLSLIGWTLRDLHARGVIPSNPMVDVQLPAERSPRASLDLTPENLSVIISAIPDHARALAMTLAATGGRYGEITALTGADVDLARSTITIERAWDASGRLGPPKTSGSNRVASIPSTLIPILREQMAGKGPNDLLFTLPSGRRITQPTFWHYWHAARMALADETGEDFHRRVRVHHLRHLVATRLIMSGVPLPVVGHQLGHSSIRTTVDTYGHIDRAVSAAAIEHMGSFIPQPQ